MKPNHKKFRKQIDKYIIGSENELFDKAVSELNELDRLYSFGDQNPDATGTTGKRYAIIIHRTSAMWKNEVPVDKQQKWGYFPTENQRKFCSQFTLDIHQDHRLRSILAAYATEDPNFAVGGSKRLAPRMDLLHFEVDYDMGDDEIVDETFARRHIHGGLVEFLHEHAITPHFLISGHHSIYAAFHFKNQIAKETMVRFHQAIKRLLMLGGKVDAHTLGGSAIRYPLSHHIETGQICRYLGNESRADVIETMRNIEKDTITDSELARVSELIVEKFPYYSHSTYEGRVKSYIEYRSPLHNSSMRPSLDSEELKNLEELKKDPWGFRKKQLKWEKKRRKEYLINMKMTPLWDEDSGESSVEIIVDDMEDEIASLPMEPNANKDIFRLQEFFTEYLDNVGEVGIEDGFPDHYLFDDCEDLPEEDEKVREFIQRTIIGSPLESKLDMTMLSDRFLPDGFEPQKPTPSEEPSSKATSSLPKSSISDMENKFIVADSDDDPIETSEIPTPPIMECGYPVASNSIGIDDRWTMNHPQRTEFECYLKDGIPNGMHNYIFIKSEFPMYVFHLYNSVEVGLGVLEKVLESSGSQMQQDSMQKLDYRLEGMNFRPRIRTRKTHPVQNIRWKDVVLNADEAEWLKTLEGYYVRRRKNYSKENREARMVTAGYILKKLHLHPNGADLGGSDLMREFEWKESTADKRFLEFTKKIPILVKIKDPVAHVLKTRYIRVLDLPTIDETFLAKQPIKGTSPSTQKTDAFLNAHANLDALA